MSSKDKSSRFDALFGVARSAKTPETESTTSEVKHPDIQTSKSKNPQYQRTTLYISKILHRKFKMAAMEEEREMSEIMEELIEQWLEKRKNF